MDNKAVKNIALIAFVIAIYYVIGRLSLILSFKPEDIAAVWPASGIFLSAILLSRKKLRPYIVAALFITDFVIETRAGSAVMLSLLYAFSLTLDAVLSAWLLIHFFEDSLNFNKIRQVLFYIVFSVIISNAIASSVAAFGPFLILKLPYWASWKLWWSSDAVGNLLTTPLILSWAYFFRKKPKQSNLVEFLALIFLMTVINYFALDSLGQNDNLFLFLNFMTFPFLIWAALRFGVRGVATSSLILTILVLYFIGNGHITVSTLNMIILVQLYLSLISISSLILASLVSERKTALDVLHESEEKFRGIFENSPVGKSITEFDGSVRVNKAFSDMLGYSFEEFRLLDLKDITHPEDIPIRTEMLKSILDGQKEADHAEIRYLHKNGSIVYADTRATLYKDHKGAALFWITAFSDITERKRTEILLKEKSEEIEAQNEEYMQINEELSRKNEELIDAKERAEESDRLKTAFLQNMSHEIRTPMNAIVGFSELLAHRLDDKAKLLEFSNIIRIRCNDLLKIVNDVLDISRIDSGQIPVRIEECNLTELFAGLLHSFQAVQAGNDKRHIELILQSSVDPAENIIFTDKLKLQQIFTNLIDNAFKFTDTGRITGGCKSDLNNKLVFYISDTGLGIPLEKQEFIFERFSQLNMRPDKLVGGTGLGLAIVKGLVELLGGEIWLESEIGKGTTFYFTISSISKRS